MFKIFIDDVEVKCDNQFDIEEEFMNPSSIILTNVYPANWTIDDLLENYYFPEDYTKCKIYKDDILYFIEVKYRTSDAFGFPLEAITKSKLEKIKAGASYYLSNTKEKFKSYRISAVSILGSKINFIENILF